MNLSRNSKTNEIELLKQKVRIRDLSLKKLLSQFANEIDTNRLEDKLTILENRQKAILKDTTKTIDKRKILVRDAFLKDIVEYSRELDNIAYQYQLKLKGLKMKYKTEELRAKSFTEEQKVLLPLVKESYEKGRNSYENDNFSQALLFLADNGIVGKDAIKNIELQTPAHIRDEVSKVENIINYIQVHGESIVRKVEDIENDQSLNEIERNIYKG